MPCVHGVEYLLGAWGVETLDVKQEINSTLFLCLKTSTMATQQDIHIGHLIKAVFDESGMTVSEFARQIHLERTTVYSLFERPSIDSMQLAQISLVLKHNFLSDVEEHYGLIPKASSFTIHLDNLSPEVVLQLTDLLNK
ncbi:MAG: hypothetical protein K6G25_09835 [Bacteroidales bacterium]|nr:hypothetical protein [Bacteroidales bacterium]